MTLHTVGRSQAWLDITAVRQHTQSNDVGRCMPSSPLGSTNSRTTSGMESHHRLWNSSHSQTAWGVACLHRPWTDCMVRRFQAWHAIIALGRQTWSNDVGLGMKSPPLDSTHGRTTSGMASNHRLLVAHMVERHRAWHAIRILRRQTRSNNVGRGMPSPPLDNIYSQMTSGVACHHGPLIAHTVEPHRALYAIIALG